MRRKLQTKVGAAIRSQRKTVVEPAFGQIKQARGFRQFPSGPPAPSYLLSPNFQALTDSLISSLGSFGVKTL
jgi:hypothetical protein